MGGRMQYILDRLDNFAVQIRELRQVVESKRRSNWMSKKRSCQYLGIGFTKLNELISSGRLKSHKVDGLIRIHRSDIDSLILFEKPYKKLTTPQRREVQELEK